MQLRDPEILDIRPGQSGLDEDIAVIEPVAAVFLLWPREGSPYLARTASLRRRLKRLLSRRQGTSRLLNLREVVSRVEYWPTGSRLESFLISLALGRRHFPEDYRRRLKLRMPPYVKLILSHRFPRTLVTTRLSASHSIFYGPFRTRIAAERFESEFLDLFQIRRCPEDFEPSPDHPGCIYGEMNRCLRPCQQVVGEDEYRSEVGRVAEFFSTGGESLLKTVAGARERFSDELNFEEAARQHQRYERIQQVLRLRDGLAGDIERCGGVAVTPSTVADAVDLRMFLRGVWQPPRQFSLQVVEGRPVSLDKRLRELFADLSPERASTVERQEHLAVLARWYYSSWRDGEWLPFDDLESLPYRKLVNAIHRVATA